MFCLFGPTASGKTRLLLKLFDSNTAEVINADSMQVFRGLEIGTAKPTAAERDHLTHHLIDVVAPDQPWHVGEFVRSAEVLIDEILEAGRLPVVSGGTAFYIRGLLCGLPEAPPASPEVRQTIRQRMHDEGAEALHGELAGIDPESAANISRSDEYRIARALEIFHDSGLPRSAFCAHQEVRAEYDPVIVAIDRPREELYRRINVRVAEMFKAGLVDEVIGLVEAGYGPGSPGMRAIGYREFLSHPRVEAEGIGSAREPDVAADIERLIARNSRHYAKRQLTFFRRIPGVQWVSANDEARVFELSQIALDRVHTPPVTLDSEGGFE